MAFEAKILADSISHAGHRLTTFQITFPRFILAEVNTHCMLSRSSASSRAIPVSKKIADMVVDPFVPHAFGKNQKGMQAGAALEGDEARAADEAWREAMLEARRVAVKLANLGVHKSYANRLIEPFTWHTAIITATDWSNFFNLRDNTDAQGEFQVIASMMRELYGISDPRELGDGEWHLPLIYDDDVHMRSVPDGDLPKVSAARCARVSYLTHDGKRDLAEDLRLYETLVQKGHMSPLEHVARPMTEAELALTRAWDISFGGPMLRVRCTPPQIGDEWVLSNGRRVTVTAVRGPLNYCGKLNGWCSLRSTIPGEWDVLGERTGGAT